MISEKQDSFLTEITDEEGAMVSGGFNLNPLSLLPDVSVYIDPDGNPDTDSNYYIGNFNDKPTQFPGVKWEIRLGEDTWAKGYGKTPGYLKSWLKDQGVNV
ncbi:hypothetical protein Riv7116_4999 [Rivularia sp. PCC 7116]|uniref:hypothetical protein n=1 Tax=Rivularia sp. PCC 7116 TaxID=373994 RepID=UPI00029F1AE2|nr:hypothetical protein [Rivularia sp. PCC 7116]AFY57405.1 hypothetical protein Riv7116_4999 [Rivularia sp. PCC 7116]